MLFRSMQLPDDTPREMSVEEIKELIEKFGRAAQRARQCGFDAVELHGAHGYMPLKIFTLPSASKVTLK